MFSAMKMESFIEISPLWISSDHFREGKKWRQRWKVPTVSDHNKILFLGFMHGAFTDCRLPGCVVRTIILLWHQESLTKWLRMRANYSWIKMHVETSSSIKSFTRVMASFIFEGKCICIAQICVKITEPSLINGFISDNFEIHLVTIKALQC